MNAIVNRLMGWRAGGVFEGPTRGGCENAEAAALLKEVFRSAGDVADVIYDGFLEFAALFGGELAVETLSFGFPVDDGGSECGRHVGDVAGVEEFGEGDDDFVLGREVEVGGGGMKWEEDEGDEEE